MSSVDKPRVGYSSEYAAKYDEIAWPNRKTEPASETKRDAKTEARDTLPCPSNEEPSRA